MMKLDLFLVYMITEKPHHCVRLKCIIQGKKIFWIVDYTGIFNKSKYSEILLNNILQYCPRKERQFYER